MSIPYVVARANRVLLNPLARRLAGKVPPVVLIEHRGRRSGRRFRTPVFGFFEDDNAALVIVLTYGPDVDWLKNLRAAGGGEVVARGGTHRVGSPEIRTGVGQDTAIPLPIRSVLRLLPVTQVARPAVRPLPTATGAATSGDRPDPRSRRSPERHEEPRRHAARDR